MSPKQITALRIDVELMEIGKRVKQTEGIPVTAQIEIAYREWLEKRGSLPKRKKAR